MSKDAARLHKLCRCSLLRHHAILEHHNFICTGNRAHPVSDDEDRFIFDKT